MNLEYEISLEYDVALQQAYWEYSLIKEKLLFLPTRYFPIFLCVASTGFIVWGLFEKTLLIQYY